MRQLLTLQETKDLVYSSVERYGVRGAARHLTAQGYLSPLGYRIQQGHIARIKDGAITRLIGPEEAPSEALQERVLQERDPSDCM